MANQVSTRFRPIIRIFVSSTFSDFKRERDALQKWAFPELERTCWEHDFQFQAIDLRWGVPGEAGLHHRTMQICFEELRRSQEISPQPNFLILLGDRYGWRPLPEAITAEEFEKLVKVADGRHGSAPIPGALGKTSRQILNEWYRHDQNVLDPRPRSVNPDCHPLTHILQPRRQDLGDDRDYTRTNDSPPKDTENWQAVQNVLWTLINVAFPIADFISRFAGFDWKQHIDNVSNCDNPQRAVPQIVRFQGSATEQEIWAGALSVHDAAEHVRAVFRKIDNGDGFERRTIRDFFDLDEKNDFDAVAQDAQKALKIQIGDRLGNHTVTAIPWSRLKDVASGTKDGPIISVDADSASLQAFCSDIVESFKPIIERQIHQFWNATDGDCGLASQTRPSIDSLSPSGGDRASNAEQHTYVERPDRKSTIEIDEHLRFAAAIAPKGTFVGRDVEVTRVKKYLTDDNRRPLVMYGPSGTGKTALLAHVAYNAGLTIAGLPSDRAIKLVRFLGTTPTSSSVCSLLESLCRELRLHFAVETSFPKDILGLQYEFHNQLGKATADRPVYIFLDALDQLDDADAGRELGWLRIGSLLPPNVKLIISCLSDSDDEPTQRPLRRLSFYNLLDAGIKLNSLSPDEAEDLFLNHWLKSDLDPSDSDYDHLGRPRRTLSPTQRELVAKLIQRPDAAISRRPLYLKILFEEARLWRSYDVLPNSLPETVEGHLKCLVERLSLDANHGSLLVERVLGYVGAARRGLSETEILEVLFQDDEYKKDLDEESEKNCHALPGDPPRIPVAIWSRLRSDLTPYLADRAAPGGSVIAFYHRQVDDWVKTEFIDGVDWSPHGRLARYFGSQSDLGTIDDEQLARERQVPIAFDKLNLRKIDELPRHLHLAGEWDALARLLSKVPFFQACWNHNQYDITSLWLKVEEESSVSLPDAYQFIFKDLDAYIRMSGANRWTARFLSALAQTMHITGHPDESFQLCDALIGNFAAEHKLPAIILQATLCLNRGRRGDYQTAMTLATEARRIAHSNGDLTNEISAMGLQCTAFLENNQHEDALQIIKEQRKLLANLDHRGLLADSLGNEAVALTAKGQFNEALALHEEEEVICRELEDLDGLQACLGNKANLLGQLGNTQSAIAILSEQEKICKSIGKLLSLANCYSNQAYLFAIGGEKTRAKELLKKQEELARQIGSDKHLKIAIEAQQRLETM